MRKYLCVLCCTFFSVSYSQVLTINVSESNFGIDEEKLLIVTRFDDLEDYTELSGYSGVSIKLGDANFEFNSLPSSLNYTLSYSVMNTSTAKTYDLYFSNLPIISISTNNAISDEPKVLANFTYADKEQTFVSNIGIEIRGGSSKSYPKKSFDIEIWEDTEGDDTGDAEFGSLREDDDWILDAIYNEPLRLRSYVANKLWLDLHDEPHYSEDESKAKTGADVMYVEVFLNGVYNGLYNLSEQIDKKQLKLKSYKDEIRGELYKGISWGASTFSSLPTYDNDNNIWSGYQVKYPKVDDIIDWGNLYSFTNFVINSSDSNFSATIWDSFDKDNYIDYFLFINLIRATDNTGKNIYLAKYKADSPYFYVPWDLDGCFGTIYNGERSDITEDILSNGFFTRVKNSNPKNVSLEIKNRWFELRQTILTNDALASTISTQYNSLKENKLYERESLVYPNYTFEEGDLSYTLSWLENRLSFLDSYFGVETLSSGFKVSDTIVVYPNPANDRLYVSIHDFLKGSSFRIYNSLGQKVYEGILDTSYVSTNMLLKGVYSIQIADSTLKFIKH